MKMLWKNPCFHTQTTASWDPEADLMNELRRDTRVLISWQECHSCAPKSRDTISFPAKAAVAIVILTTVMKLLHFQQQPP